MRIFLWFSCLVVVLLAVQQLKAQSSGALIERKIKENLQNGSHAYEGLDALHSFSITIDRSISESDITYQEDKTRRILADQIPVSSLSIKNKSNGEGLISVVCDATIDWGVIKKCLRSMGFVIIDTDVDYIIRN